MGNINSNEITVKVNVSIKEMQEILINKGFKLSDKFTCEDNYFIPKDVDIKSETIREIIKKAIIIRKVRNDKVLVFKKKNINEKKKNINENGDIVEQEKFECDILDIDKAKKFLEAIGYKNVMDIFEEDVCYSKDGLGLALKNIKNGDNLMEVETQNIEGFRTTKELKEKLLKLNLPIDTSNFFVKKAEVELEKVINKTIKNN